MIGIVALLTLLVCLYRRNPFHYPYFEHEFDVSGRRNVDIDHEIDLYLDSPYGWNEIQEHERKIAEWRTGCDRWISRHWLKKHRRRQYEQTLDDEHCYRFETVRSRTRYRQVNYVRHPYTVMTPDRMRTFSHSQLVERHASLGFVTLNDIEAKQFARKQRALMTPQLRRRIMIRDDYTCRRCGKRMPDEVGLQIDHIIPIAKGGRTIPSNLQVLCSKCNGSKGAKTPGKEVRA